MILDIITGFAGGVGCAITIMVFDWMEIRLRMWKDEREDKRRWADGASAIDKGE